MRKQTKFVGRFFVVSSLTIVLLTTSILPAAGCRMRRSRCRAFTHGITISLDGYEWYLDGPSDGENGEKDIPGMYWHKIGDKFLIGKAYNTGPYGEPSWWSSDARDGGLLWIVLGRIDIWTQEKAEYYYKRGFVYYHKLIRTDGAMYHPTKIVWLMHIGVWFFTFDGGPFTDMTPYRVRPGIDRNFPSNAMTPYPDLPM